MWRRPVVHRGRRRHAPSRPWTVVALLLGLFLMHGVTTTAPAVAGEDAHPTASATTPSALSAHPCHPETDGHPPAHEHCAAVVSKTTALTGPELCTVPSRGGGIPPDLSVRPTGSALDPSAWPRPPDLSDLCLLRI